MSPMILHMLNLLVNYDDSPNGLNPVWGLYPKAGLPWPELLKWHPTGLLKYFHRLRVNREHPI